MAHRLLFAHIPKAAGSTLTRILLKYANPKKILQIQPLTHKTQISEFLALPREEQEKYDLILGENAYRIRDQIPGEISCLTIFREPLDRVVSLYYFILKTQSHYLHQELISTEMSLTEFLKTGMSPKLENQMTAIISRLGRKKIIKDPQFALEQAIENLEQDFFHVGLMEHFDLSLMMLKKKLVWETHPYYLSENVQHSDSSVRSAVDPGAVEIFREKNQLDQKLYDYVSRRFNDEVEAGGETLKIEVADFQKENQKYISRNLPLRKIRDRLSVIKKMIS